MNDTVKVMKRVNAILQACRDDARLRTRVAEETAKWVRTKDTNVARDFESFLNRLEKKFNVVPPFDEAETPNKIIKSVVKRRFIRKPKIN